MDDRRKLNDEAAPLKEAVTALDAPPSEPETLPETAVDAPVGAVAPAKASSPLPPEEIDRLTADIVAALKTVYDPEIPCDIYELGLIYRVEIDDDRFVAIDMTLTAPGCPVAGEMPGWVESAVNVVPGVAGSTVKIVFDPPWDMSRMSDEARLATGMF